MLMKQTGLTQNEFAKALNIAPASLSSIFNGRTSPTRNHVEAVHRYFPRVSVNWLMFGEGDMYVDSDGGSTASTIANTTSNTGDGMLPLELYSDGGSPVNGNSSPTVSPRNAPLSHANNHTAISEAVGTTVREVVKMIDKPQRKIVEIRIFFDDGTYETFSPNK